MVEPREHAIHSRALLIIAACGVLMSAGMLFSQSHGKDELLTLRAVSRVWQGLRDGDFPLAVRAIGTDWHPPGRNLLPVPFVALFGDNVWALRLPNLLVWGMTSVLAAFIAGAIKGEAAGWYTGLGLALSGLFQIQVMGLGHGVATFWGLAVIGWMVRHPPQGLSTRESRLHYIIAASLAVMGFLWFTSLFVLSVGLHAYYLVRTLRIDANERLLALRWWCVLTVPYGIFYLAYYAIFLGLPYYLVAKGIAAGPFGQLHQYHVRADTAHFNIDAMIENIKVTNYYTFPVVFLIVTLIGLAVVMRRFPYVGFVVVPYAFIVSFYMSGDTGQHFLSFVIWMLPFGVAGLVDYAKSRTLRLIFASVLISWTVVLHVWPYPDARYPYWVSKLTFGDPKWLSNSLFPLEEIKNALHEWAGDGVVASLASGTWGVWGVYYAPELKWETNPIVLRGAGSCFRGVATAAGEQVGAVLASKAELPCPDTIAQMIEFQNSRIVLFLFH